MNFYQNPLGAVAGIILAAGRSSRMGRVKQILPWQGSTILGEVLRQARLSCLNPLTVVLGHEAGRITREVDLKGARVAINPDFAKGQSSSLQAGLDQLPESVQAALFLLGDQPLVSAAVIDRLVRKYHELKSPLLIPVYQGRRGNPVLIERKLFPELMRLQGDTGARVLFEEHADSIHEVQVSEKGILQDIDTWAQYQELFGQEKG
ncbi:MAG: molybdenum cofactor cytidylyltransferase [Desulfohalobiaceae bacterium]|nr:molybdenum cofactor cytidylyltransferase [Desulfohalobiaceae bacterium]